MTQVPYTAVQNNMRQSLMALSDHIADPQHRFVSDCFILHSCDTLILSSSYYFS